VRYTHLQDRAKALPVSHWSATVHLIRTRNAYLESNAKEDIIQEEESHTGLCYFGRMGVAGQLIISDHDCDDQVAEALARSGVHEHLPSTPAFDVRDPDG
jgi:hypothetical protein